MYTENDSAPGADESRESGAKKRWNGHLRRRSESLVPGFAVGLVAITAVAAAVMATRPDPEEGKPADTQMPQAEASTLDPQDVVKAPPMGPQPVVKAPPLKAPASPPGQARVSDTQTLGVGPACRNCGVVQMVVAVHGYAQPQPSGYQMHIRMDDGSVRTVEQRGALAAGSRVIVERDSVRVLADRSGQG
jgi:hypothetical protein